MFDRLPYSQTKPKVCRLTFLQTIAGKQTKQAYCWTVICLIHRDQFTLFRITLEHDFPIPPWLDRHNQGLHSTSTSTFAVFFRPRVGMAFRYRCAAICLSALVGKLAVVVNSSRTTTRSSWRSLSQHCVAVVAGVWSFNFCLYLEFRTDDLWIASSSGDRLNHQAVTGNNKISWKKPNKMLLIVTYLRNTDCKNKNKNK